MYGLDLGDMWRGGVTIRRVAALTAHLPTGSQVWRSFASDLAWGETEYLLAVVADAVMAGNWQRGGGKGNKPDPVPRPRDAAEQRQREARAVMQAAQFARKQAARREGGE